jgi:CheY-like chemotaxis protein
MQSNTVPPFFFPSMVAFVDDSRDFLDNLSLQLAPNLAFRLYDSPVDALIALNGTSSRAAFPADFLSVSQQGDDLPLSHHVLDLNLDRIAREVHNPARFEQISVVVVDYDMPEIDGLELCQNIKNPAVKKILLTGKADEKTAVRAFNQRRIDRFLLKQDPDIIPMLNQAIAELQQDYCKALGRTVIDALSLGSHPFLRDEKFAEVFRQICARLDATEFYLTSTPAGFLLLDATGMASQLIVKTGQDLRDHFDIAQDQEAPAELLGLLRRREVVPCFPGPDGEYTPECEDWRACLHPASRIEGNDQDYYYALLSPISLAQGGKVCAYNEFLQWLDGQENEHLPLPARPRP